MSVTDWSTTASDNGSIGGVNIAENCPAGNVNNAIRELMAEFAEWLSNPNLQPKDATLTALAALTTSADKLVYANGVDSFATTELSAYVRGLLAANDAGAFLSAIGAVRVSAASLASPGYIRFQIGPSSFFQVAWGLAAVPPGGANIYYPAAFPSAAFPVLAGGVGGTGTQVNNPAIIVSGTSATGFNVGNPRGETIQVSYVAVGF